jgi:hypothetical protein
VGKKAEEMEKVRRWWLTRRAHRAVNTSKGVGAIRAGGLKGQVGQRLAWVGGKRRGAPANLTNEDSAQAGSWDFLFSYNLHPYLNTIQI